MAQQDDTTTAATEVEELRQRVAELEGRSTRRNMLRLAGAAVVGGVAASVAGAQPAAATSGTMQYGVSNDAGADSTYLSAALLGTAFGVFNPQAFGSSQAILGNAFAGGTGVLGRISSPTTFGAGLWGHADGTTGFGVVAEGGAAQVYIKPNANGHPATGLHRKGEISSGGSGLYACVVGDGTGVGTWRTLAAINSAGALFPITPTRVYDSRRLTPGPQSTLATGASRTISVADGRLPSSGLVNAPNIVPAGATAIAYNLTVVNTVGTNGFLAVNEGGNTTVSASAINWSASGLTLANGSLVKLNDSRQITVICGGTATSCNFIIDVVGYYR